MIATGRARVHTLRDGYFRIEWKLMAASSTERHTVTAPASLRRKLLLGSAAVLVSVAVAVML